MHTPWWQALLYYLFIKPIAVCGGFIFRNIISGISKFIQKMTVSFLMITIGVGFLGYIVVIAN